jgi:predicted SAM-dependent methyltransferase
MPIEGGALSWAYAEHFLEHITPEEAVRWLREVRRLLAPGGVVRVTTPDLARYVRGYLEESDAFYALHRERTARLGFPPMETRKAWMLNQIFQYWGHRWIYDADEVRHVMRQAGFEPERVTVQTYGRSREPEMAGLDWEIRNDDTLYVEAVV